MSDVSERLDNVEQRLTRLGERMDERFTQVDLRFEQIDRRFKQIDLRFELVDQRFEQVDQRFEQVDRRFDRVEARLDGLVLDVQKLRVLGEENAMQIRQIAEVQSHHARLLQQLLVAVEPLKALPGLFDLVARDHERRITALEQARPNA